MESSCQYSGHEPITQPPPPCNTETHSFCTYTRMVWKGEISTRQRTIRQRTGIRRSSAVANQFGFDVAGREEPNDVRGEVASSYKHTLVTQSV